MKKMLYNIIDIMFLKKSDKKVYFFCSKICICRRFFVPLQCNWEIYTFLFMFMRERLP